MLKEDLVEGGHQDEIVSAQKKPPKTMQNEFETVL